MSEEVALWHLVPVKEEQLCVCERVLLKEAKKPSAEPAYWP